MKYQFLIIDRNNGQDKVPIMRNAFPGDDISVMVTKESAEELRSLAENHPSGILYDTSLPEERQMKTGERKYGNRGRMIVAAVLLCLLLAILATGYLTRVHSCLFATQLVTDPAALAGYQAAVAAGRSGYGANGNIDPISLQCLACHDGVIAPAAPYRISDGTLSQTMSIETIIGAHPLGMSYLKATVGRNFTPEDRLPPDMVLMYGNVGCVTCHNLLGNNVSYLVVDNESSRLCFCCHSI